MVEPAFVAGGAVVLFVSLVLTAAFYTLNSNLEDENRRLKEKLKQYE